MAKNSDGQVRGQLNRLSANNVGIDDLQDFIYQQAQMWVGLDQWQVPDSSECVDFVIEEAGEAFSAKHRLVRPGYTRNNPRDISWDNVDEEIADTLIMCLRYFNQRGKLARLEIGRKLDAMHRKRIKEARNGPDSPSTDPSS